MNPELPNTPREELELRVTALLLGELSAVEAAAVREAIAKDPELAKLHDALKATIHLVREAVSSPGEAASAQAAPIRLSEERRQKLLAQFKTVRPKEFVAPRRSFESWLLPTAAVAAVVLLLVALSIPNFVRSRNTSSKNAVMNNLRQLDGAKQQWALENNKSATDIPTFDDLKPYLRGNELPSRIAGETYALGSVEDQVTAEIDAGQARKRFGGLPAEQPVRGVPGQRVRLSVDGELALADKDTTGWGLNQHQKNGNVVLAEDLYRGASPSVIRSAARTAVAPRQDIILPSAETSVSIISSGVSGGGGAGGVQDVDQVTFNWRDTGPMVAGESSSVGDASDQFRSQLQTATRAASFSGLPAEAQSVEQAIPNPSPPAVIPPPSLMPAPEAEAPPKAVGGGERGSVAFANSSPEQVLLRMRRASENQSQAGAVPSAPPPPVALALNAGTATTPPSTPEARGGGGGRGGGRGGRRGGGGTAPVPPRTPAEAATITITQPDSLATVTADRGVTPSSPIANNLTEARKLPELGRQEVLGLSFENNDPVQAQRALSGLFPGKESNTQASARPDFKSLSLNGVGELTLSGTNAYSGGAVIKNGTIGIQAGKGTWTNDAGLNIWGDVFSWSPNVADANYVQSVNGDITNSIVLPSTLSLAKDGAGEATFTVDQATRQVAVVTDAKTADNIEQIVKGKAVHPGQQMQEEDRPIRRASTNAPIPQPEIQTSENNFSTFSLNVSDVSFKLAAASLEKGQMPDPASVRSEEFINAFDYRDPEPKAGAPVAFAWERARYPFAHNRDLLRLSVKTAAAGRQVGRPLNIVLLLDNSGSMERADRVQIIREALRVLASQLQPQDKLSVITFARTARLVADGVSGDKAGEVTEQVAGLTPEGGTNLEDAMNLAYQTAARHYLANGVNRVVLLTDGAANLGDVEPESLKLKVEAQRKQGIALDCFGIGWEGFNDDLLEVLSRNGDGRYGFINSPEEAASDFAGQLAGALKVAASDVKVQVEFNPKRVISYRQIGYAKHQLTKEQFRDNTVDAAEIAAQEAGNALYTVEVNPTGEGPLATVRVRYKIPGTADYREQAWAVPYTGNAPPLDRSGSAMRLAASASAFSEWLVASPFAGEVTPDALLGYLGGVPEVYGADTRPKKLEWMIRQAKSLEGR